MPYTMFLEESYESDTNQPPNAVIIDIASNKSGADYETAQKLDVNIHFCPGLPGKYAGESCAKYLTDYVINRI